MALPVAPILSSSGFAKLLDLHAVSYDHVWLLILLLLKLAILLLRLLLLALVLASLFTHGLAQIRTCSGRGVDRLHLGCRFGDSFWLGSAKRPCLDNWLLLLIHSWQNAQFTQFECLSLLRFNRLVRCLALSVQIVVPYYLHVGGAFEAANTLQLEEFSRVPVRIVLLMQARL